MQESGIVALTADVVGGETKLLDIDGKVRKRLQTVMYVSSSKSSESRACYQARRWGISKMEQGIVKGKFDGGMSSVLANCLNRIFESVNAAGGDGKIMVGPNVYGKKCCQPEVGGHRPVEACSVDIERELACLSRL